MRQSLIFEALIRTFFKNTFFHNRFQSLTFYSSTMSHTLKKNESSRLIKPYSPKYSTKSTYSESSCQNQAHQKFTFDKAQTTHSQNQTKFSQSISNLSKEFAEKHQIFYVHDEIYSQEVFNQQSEYLPDITKHQQKYETQQIQQLLHSLTIQNEQLFFETQLSAIEQNQEKDNFIFYVTRMAIKQYSQRSYAQQIIEYGPVQFNFEENYKESNGSNSRYFILENFQKENPIIINIEEYCIYVNRFKPWIIWLIKKVENEKIILLQFENLQSTSILLNYIGLQKTREVRFYDFFTLNK